MGIIFYLTGDNRRCLQLNSFFVHPWGGHEPLPPLHLSLTVGGERGTNYRYKHDRVRNYCYCYSLNYGTAATTAPEPQATLATAPHLGRPTPPEAARQKALSKPIQPIQTTSARARGVASTGTEQVATMATLRLCVACAGGL